MRLNSDMKRRLGRVLGGKQKRGVTMNTASLETLVDVIFQAVLARRPDPDGMRTYTSVMKSGEMTAEDVLTEVRSSDEGHLARTLDCTSLVVPALYEALLDRTSTQDEVNHWRKLAAATGGIGEVVRSILEMPSASRAQLQNAIKHQGMQALFLAEYRRSGVIDG